VNVGKYRHRIALQSATDTRTADGGVSQSWSTTNTVWAQLIPAGGTEQIHADKTRADTTHIARIRFGVTVTADMRFTHESRTFQILNVYDDNEGRRELIIEAEEITK